MAPRPLNVTERQKFGWLTTVTSTGYLGPKRGWGWACECICGNKVIAPDFLLIRGEKSSCGCKQKVSRQKNPRGRFEANVMPEPNSGCWIWLGNANEGTGYGTFLLESGRNMGAHRAAWIIYRGEIPADMHLCHKCDNRICVNPDHLFIGTSADNMADASRKRRMKHGEHHYRAKLNNQQVIEIRAAAKPVADMATEYGVTTTTIRAVQTYKMWRHI